MSIAAIIEKYTHEYCGFGQCFNMVHEEDFPALTAELETLMREEAVAFLTWARFSLKNTPLGMVIIEDKEVPKNLYDEGEIYQYYLTSVKK